MLIDSTDYHMKGSVIFDNKLMISIDHKVTINPVGSGYNLKKKLDLLFLLLHVLCTQMIQFCLEKIVEATPLFPMIHIHIV